MNATTTPLQSPLLPFNGLPTLVLAILSTPFPTPLVFILTMTLALSTLFFHIYAVCRIDVSSLAHQLGIPQIVADINQISYERRRIRARVLMVAREAEKQQVAMEGLMNALERRRVIEKQRMKEKEAWETQQEKEKEVWEREKKAWEQSLKEFEDEEDWACGHIA